jgi:hypothetical protein
MAYAFRSSLFLLVLFHENHIGAMRHSGIQLTLAFCYQSVWVWLSAPDDKYIVADAAVNGIMFYGYVCRNNPFVVFTTKFMIL